MRRMVTWLGILLAAGGLGGLGTAGAQDQADLPDIENHMSARFDGNQFTTFYEVQPATDPNGRPLTYTWTKDSQRTCGRFSGSGTSASWYHPHVESGVAGADCPEEDVHPGVITLLVSNGIWDCRVVYRAGSASSGPRQGDPGLAPCDSTPPAGGDSEEPADDAGDRTAAADADSDDDGGGLSTGVKVALGLGGAGILGLGLSRMSPGNWSWLTPANYTWLRMPWDPRDGYGPPDDFFDEVSNGPVVKPGDRPVDDVM